MRMFPILNQSKIKHDLLEVPWDMLVPFEKQAIINHEQDLETLAKRGGLNAEEMFLVLLERPLGDFYRVDWSKLDVISTLKEGVNAWLQDQGLPPKYPAKL